MRTLLASITLTICATVVLAGDWPTWRYDAARSAASPDGIATNPALLWSRKLPPVHQAWPREQDQRINFDAAYAPVVMGKRLFLASPNDGSVTAYHTDSGAEQWKFFADGPVRCAPACWKGKLYVGSDDGYLYCLDAQTGNVLWKFRGAPADRPDRRQLGNGHLVSFWPMRGGPVVADGVVYAGAGIWPVFGVFLHALDAETGKAKWTNSELNYVGPVRTDHDSFLEVGMSPQGYLVAIGSKLLVPNSRALPAGVDRDTGRLLYYMQGGRHGDSRVAAHGDYAFVGKDGVMNLYDLREVGSRWAHRGNYKPAGYRGPVLWPKDLAVVPRVFDRVGYNGDYDLYESPGWSYKVVDGCDASSAFDNRIAYGSVSGVFYAYDLADTQLTASEEVAFGRKINPLKWRPKLVWTLKTPSAGQSGVGVIKAGKRIYGYAGRKLMAVEGLEKEPRLAWEADLDGRPDSLIAADNKLFVTSEEGGLYCLGEGSPGTRFDAPPARLEAKMDEWCGRAEEIVKTSGVTTGYVLVLGLGEGRLIEELLKQPDLLVLGVDPDAAKIDRLRRHFAAAGLIGSRVELFTGRPFEFGFPPYLASLIVSEDPKAAGFSTESDAAKLFQVLRPYGGTLCLDWPAAAHPDFEKWAQRAALARAMVKRAGALSLLVREGALPGSGAWTHEAADAACTFTSPDDLVRAPLGILWYGDDNGFARYKDYGTGTKPLVNGGRVYALAGALIAYDAYTGRLLWKSEVKAFRGHARFAAMDDGIYVVADGKCIVLEPASGRLLNTFTFNAAGATTAKDVRVDGDVIIVACSEVNEEDLKDETYWNRGFFESRLLVGMDRKTGAELWRRPAKQRFSNLGLASGGGLFFCVDSIPAVLNDPTGRSVPPKESDSTIYALDPRSGKKMWSQRIAYPLDVLRWGGDFVQYAADQGILLTGRKPTPIGLAAVISALDAKTGKILWAKRKIGQAPVILHGNTFLSGDGEDHGGATTQYDIRTGESIGTIPFLIGGCNYLIGSKHLLMGRSGTAGYTDIDRKKAYTLRNIRSGCSINLPAADGVVSAPNMSFGCVCNYPLQTSYALMTMPEVEAWAGTVPVSLLPPPASADMEAKGKEESRRAEALPPRFPMDTLKGIVCIDLSAAANRSLSDDVDNDGEGGWSDQGPFGDMRELQTGERRLGGVPFKILDGPRSVVVLKSSQRPPGRLPEKVTIPVGRKADVLFFLHSAAWCAAGNDQAFRYVIHYADGQDVVLPVTGHNLSDWINDPVSRFPQEENTFTTAAETVHVRRYGQGTIYRMEWSAPVERRGVTIENIEFIGGGKSAPILVAITAGVTDEEKAKPAKN